MLKIANSLIAVLVIFVFPTKSPDETFFSFRYCNFFPVRLRP